MYPRRSLSNSLSLPLSRPMTDYQTESIHSATTYYTEGIRPPDCIFNYHHLNQLVTSSTTPFVPSTRLRNTLHLSPATLLPTLPYFILQTSILLFMTCTTSFQFFSENYFDNDQQTLSKIKNISFMHIYIYIYICKYVYFCSFVH